MLYAQFQLGEVFVRAVEEAGGDGCRGRGRGGGGADEEIAFVF